MIQVIGLIEGNISRDDNCDGCDDDNNDGCKEGDHDDCKDGISMVNYNDGKHDGCIDINHYHIPHSRLV